MKLDTREVLKDLATMFSNYASKNIAFREFSRSDLFPLFQATRNEDFNKFLLWSTPSNIEELNIEVSKLISERNRWNNLIISICEKNTGKWFGFLKFTPYRDSFEMSYWVHPDYWESKLIVEAGWSFLDIALQHKEIKSLFCRVRTEHIKMEKLLIFTGFSKVGETIAQHVNGNIFNFNIFCVEKFSWIDKKLINLY